MIPNGLALVERPAVQNDPHVSKKSGTEGKKNREESDPGSKAERKRGLSFRDILDSRLTVKAGSKNDKVKKSFSPEKLNAGKEPGKGKEREIPVTAGEGIQIGAIKPEVSGGKTDADGVRSEKAFRNVPVIPVADEKGIERSLQAAVKGNPPVPEVKYPVSAERNSRTARREGSEGKAGPKVTVVDLRSGDAVTAAVNGKAGGGEERSFDTNGEKSGDDAVIMLKASGETSRSMTEGSTERATASSFSNRLDNLLKGDLGKEIVRQTGIVLKDHGKGEIRLVLQPERLGKVRIRLDMDDNHIAARILVENKGIREVFEQNLEHLSRSFKEGGFTADFIGVSVQGEGSERKQNFGGDRIPNRLVNEIEAMVPSLNEEIREESIVNMVV